MIEIPMFNTKSSRFIQQIILGGRTLSIEIGYNTRSDNWFMSVSDVQTAEKVSSVKLVENWLLLRQYRAALPNFNGDFIVKKVSATDAGLGFSNLGTEFKLFYVTDEESDSWETYYGVG